MSQNNPPDPIAEIGGTIAAAAGRAGARAGQTTQSVRIANLEERIASLEPLLEQLQANAALGTKLTEYVSDLRDEQVFFNRARNAAGCITILAIFSLVTLLAMAIFSAKSPLLASPPLAIAAVIVGLTSSIALLLNSFVKGVFRSTAERHADGFLPPALEKGLELLNKVSGKG